MDEVIGITHFPQPHGLRSGDLIRLPVASPAILRVERLNERSVALFKARWYQSALCRLRLRRVTVFQ